MSPFKLASFLADETTDCANREHLVFTIRWVDDNLEVHEEFIVLHLVYSIEANIIFSAIEDILLRLNLRFHKIRGECYDGASNMSVKESGVAKLISEKQLIRQLYPLLWALSKCSCNGLS